jgi:hypothetical protein
MSKHNYMNRFKPIWALSVILMLTACSKSNEVDERADPSNGGGSGTCNTTDMKYSTDIVPILQTNCYECHSNANQSISGISLEGYNNLKVVANDGRLVGVITHASGYPPMPEGKPKLSDCNINKIKSWVTNGSPNN